MNNIIEAARTIKRRLFRSVDGPKAIRGEFNRFHGRPLPDVPKTFTERLYHRMIGLHGQGNPTFTRLADKYLAREFIRERIGERYLVELLWNGTDPRQIPFDALPDVSMAKTNHASGMTMVLRRPIDRAEVVDQFDKWLATNYYWITRELQYLGIKPRIMVEEFLDDGNADGPLDYRFWCFHGRPARGSRSALEGIRLCPRGPFRRQGTRRCRRAHLHTGHRSARFQAKILGFSFGRIVEQRGMIRRVVPMPLPLSN